MLAEFGDLVDRLYRSPNPPRKKIVFIIGNGIHQVNNILNDDQVEANYRSAFPLKWLSFFLTLRSFRKTSEFRDYKWKNFEIARHISAYTFPTFAHACIYRFIRDGLCRDIITTNYDLFFDSIWEKYPDLSVQMNPVCGPTDYHWDHYYSYLADAHGKPRYWKIHGSLSHVAFHVGDRTGAPQLCRLPKFLISSRFPDAHKISDIPLVPFLGYEATIYPSMTWTDPDNINPQFAPYIDWTYDNNRNHYQKEISAASSILQDPNHTAAIFLVGFRGRYDDANPGDPWNEELIPILHRIVDAGRIKVFMAVHDNQFATLHDPTSRFMLRLDGQSRLDHFSDATVYFDQLLSRPNCTRFKRNRTWRLFNEWMDNYYIDPDLWRTP